MNKLILIFYCILTCQGILGQERIKSWHTVADSGNVFLYQGLFKQAFSYYHRALGLCTDSFRLKKSECASIYYSMGICYLNLGQLEDAKKVMERAIELTPDSGRYRFGYLLFNNALANLYLHEQNLDAAQELYERIYDKVSQKRKEEIPLYLQTIAGMAECYSMRQNYEKAFPLLNEIIGYPHKDEELIVIKPVLIQALNQLAVNFTSIGDYRNAERVHLAMTTFYDKATNPVNYVQAQTDLGAFYFAIGDMQKAEKILQNNILFIDSAHIELPADCMSIYSLLGLIHCHYKEWKNAETYIRTSFWIASQILSHENVLYLNTVGDLVNVFLKTEQLDSAKVYLDLIMKAVNKNENVTTGQLLYFYNLQAIYYSAAGQLDLAEKILSKILVMRADRDEKPLEVFAYYSNIVSVAFKSGRYSASLRYAYLAFPFFQSFVTSIGSFASSSQQLSILRDQQGFNSLVGNLALQDVSSSYRDSANRLLANIQLFSRGFIANSEKSIAIDSQQQILLRLKENLAKGISSLQLTQGRLYEIEGQMENIEKQIRYTAKKDSGSVELIGSHLKKGSVIIDYNQITICKGTKFTDSVIYTALLSHPGDTCLQFVVLCSEKQLKQVVEGKAGSGNITRSSYGDLYRLLWQPIATLLKPEDTSFYMLPVGMLTKISFAGLLNSKNEPLVSHYKFNYLSSLRYQSYPRPVTKSSRIAIVAGAIPYYTKEGSRSGVPVLRPVNWQPLPYTENEIRDVKKDLENAGYQVHSLVGDKANEAALKKAIALYKPTILHLATHGYFLSPSDFESFKDPTDRQRWARNKAWLTNGLLLSGGGDTWNGIPVDTSQEDGILTALEVSDLDLSNTELAVLSACETGLGISEGLEGVYGLQRALKAAGLKNALVSLWKVPDKETSILMERFYDNLLLLRMPADDALFLAQRSMAKDYDPKYWASFILIQ
jgi:CHAT domain-containing protein